MLVENRQNLEDFLRITKSNKEFRGDLFDSTSPATGIQHKCFWNKEIDFLRLPVFVIPEKDDLESFFADVATYYSSFSPISSYIHICNDDVAKNIFLGTKKTYKIAKPSERKLKAYLACILGDVITGALHESKTLTTGAISYASCSQAVSFSMVRSNIIYPWMKPENVAERWVLAHKIVNKEVTLSLLETTIAFLRLMDDGARTEKKTRIDVVDFNSDLTKYISGSVDEFELDNILASSFSVTNEAKMIGGAFNNRVSGFNSLAAIVESSSLPANQKSICMAYYCNRILPGSLSHVEVLRDKVKSYPDIVFWYAVFACLSDEFDMRNIASGVCIKIIRDLVSPMDFEARPSCDISIDELEVLSRLSLKASTIKPRQRRTMRVSLLPGVEIDIAFGEAEAREKIPDQYHHQPDSKKIRSLLFEALELLDERKGRTSQGDNYASQTTSKRRGY
ncbi:MULTISPECIES: hypothetical protein [unclassified Pseudomonas]|uniref:hypothetical protein n=1 Tax=unclassified Pseudomonas TaxID=196821 RepID=UPI0015A10880|nr:hypothetical protein [Pseudomonas sp. D4002]NWB19043.1 hypothetical protein [Pseudomonas sp. D4002]